MLAWRVSNTLGAEFCAEALEEALSSYDRPRSSISTRAPAWNTLAGVTTAQLPSDRQEEAKAAVRAKMWPMGDGPRQFRNLTHFITDAR